MNRKTGAKIISSWARSGRFVIQKNFPRSSKQFFPPTPKMCFVGAREILYCWKKKIEDRRLGKYFLSHPPHVTLLEQVLDLKKRKKLLWSKIIETIHFLHVCLQAKFGCKKSWFGIYYLLQALFQCYPRHTLIDTNNFTLISWKGYGVLGQILAKIYQSKMANVTTIARLIVPTNHLSSSPYTPSRILIRYAQKWAFLLLRMYQCLLIFIVLILEKWFDQWIKHILKTKVLRFY